MLFLLGCIGVVFCIALALNGFLVSLVIGGFAGSFFGVASFGGAVSGIIPGALAGALIAAALKRK